MKEGKGCHLRQWKGAKTDIFSGGFGFRRRSRQLQKWGVQLLPPATKLGQGYVFTGVCHSVNREGVPDTPQTRYIPPGADTPQDQVHPPDAEHAGRYGQWAGGAHPTGMQSCFDHLSGKLHEIEKKIETRGWACPSWIRQRLYSSESRNSVKRDHEIWNLFRPCLFAISFMIS